MQQYGEENVFLCYRTDAAVQILLQLFSLIG